MSTDTTGAAPPSRTAGGLAALCLATFVVMIDSTVVQVMLPTLITDLDSGLDEVLWVVNGFTLVYGMLLLLGARLGDMAGSRRVLLTGLLVFGAGSLLCGVADSVLVLVAGRVVQAVGGAFLVPQTLGLITVTVAPNRRGMAFGFLSASMALAAIVGPVLGGLLVAYVDWRSAFLVNVPVCLVVAGLVVRYVPAAGPARRSHHLDLVGVVLVIAGLGAVTYGFIAGNPHGWGVIAGPVSVPGLFAAGVVLLGVFSWWERRRPEPLLPLTLFSSRSFSVALWLAVLQFALMFGLMLVVTLHVQQVRGGSAFTAGLVFLPMALGAGVASPLAGHSTDRWGGRTVITAGFLAMGAGVGWLAAVLTPETTGFGLVGPLATTGLGVGLVMGPISAEAIKALPPELVNTGSGVLTTGRQVAGALGVAVVGAILQARDAGQPPALLVLAAFALVGVVSARFLPASAAGGTRTAPEPSATTTGEV